MMRRYWSIAAFLGCIPAANWLIQHVGIECVTNGPCLIPVLPGLMAPSGVLMIGAALVLRDVVHSRFGARWAAGAILAGTTLTAFIAPGPLVLASGAAFLLSEFADLAVYAPLRDRRLVMAVVLSGLVGAIVDSAAFLYLAFGSLDYLTGQVVGKMWAAIFAIPILMAMRGRV